MGREWHESEDEDFPNQMMLREQTVRNALKGRRGQKLLRELEQALLAMPTKRIITHQLVTQDGDRCLVGQYATWKLQVVGMSEEEALQEVRRRAYRKLYGSKGDIPADLTLHEYDDYKHVTAEMAQDLGVVECLSWELQWQNDEGVGAYGAGKAWRYVKTPEQRWEEMLAWVRSKLVQPVAVPT